MSRYSSICCLSQSGELFEIKKNDFLTFVCKDKNTKEIICKEIKDNTKKIFENVAKFYDIERERKNSSKLVNPINVTAQKFIKNAFMSSLFIKNYTNKSNFQHYTKTRQLSIQHRTEEVIKKINSIEKYEESLINFSDSKAILKSKSFYQKFQSLRHYKSSNQFSNKSEALGSSNEWNSQLGRSFPKINRRKTISNINFNNISPNSNLYKKMVKAFSITQISSPSSPKKKPLFLIFMCRTIKPVNAYSFNKFRI